jgi:hypothetical protein
MRLVQHLLVPERQKRMLEEIVRRTHEITPVKATQLRNEPVPLQTRVQDDVLPNDECRSSGRQLQAIRDHITTGDRPARKMTVFLLPFGA